MRRFVVGSSLFGCLSNLAAMLSRHASSFRKLVTQRVASILARRQPRRLISQPSLIHGHLTSSHFNANLASRDRSGFSDLGLRSSRPPDSIPDSDPKSPSEIPDQDWELRTGPFFRSCSLHTIILIDYRTRYLCITTDIARFLRHGAHHLHRQKDKGTSTPTHQQHPDRQCQSPHLRRRHRVHIQPIRSVVLHTSRPPPSSIPQNAPCRRQMLRPNALPSCFFSNDAN